MKRFIGEIRVEEPTLISDVCKALEGYPDSGRKYEIEMYENERGMNRPRDLEPASVVLKIFEVIDA
jgi:hypothetical protein